MSTQELSVKTVRDTLVDLVRNLESKTPGTLGYQEACTAAEEFAKTLESTQTSQPHLVQEVQRDQDCQVSLQRIRVETARISSVCKDA
jgi:hypothetical protein